MIVRQALELLTPREKRRGIVIMLLMIVKSFADMIGIGAIFPFLSLLGNPSLVETNPTVKWVYQTMGFISVDSFLVALGVIFVLLIALSACMKIVSIYAVNRYMSMRQYSLAQRLMDCYLRRPYEYFLDENSANMSSTVLSESGRAVSLFYRPAFELVNQFFTILFIMGLLLYVNPLMTFLAVITLGGSYGIAFVSVRRFVGRLGAEMVVDNAARFRFSTEALTGIKQLRLLGRERNYIDRFSSPARRLASAQATNATVSQVPRAALEVLAFGGLVLLTLSLVARNGGVGANSMAGFMPMIGLYALGGLRLMPVLQKIYSSLVTLKTGTAALNKLYDNLVELSSLPKPPSKPPVAMGLINQFCLEHVSYFYPGTQSTGLNDISLKIECGARIGIVGTTGAGKTTLTDVILGLLTPQTGCISVDGTRLNDENIRAWRASVGYVPQDIFMIDGTVAENIAFGLAKEEINAEKLDTASRLARIDEFIASELPDGFETRIGDRGLRLSGGQRQRIGIARAFYDNPDLIVFDEATSALDNRTENEIMKNIDKLPKSKTIIMIAHRLSTVQSCDVIFVLDNGVIVEKGSFQELMVSGKHFKKIADSGV